MSIFEGITAAKASLDLAKLLSDRLNRPDIDVVDVRAKVHEMLIHMVNAQIALGEAQVEIGDLRRQLDDRGAVKALEDDLDYQIDGGFYIRKSEASKGVVAYCPICWKNDGKTIPLAASSVAVGCFNCSIHQTGYKTTQGRKNEEQFYRNINRPTIAGGPDSWMR